MKNVVDILVGENTLVDRVLSKLAPHNALPQLQPSTKDTSLNDVVLRHKANCHTLFRDDGPTIDIKKHGHDLIAPERLSYLEEGNTIPKDLARRFELPLADELTYKMIKVCANDSCGIGLAVVEIQSLLNIAKPVWRDRMSKPLVDGSVLLTGKDLVAVIINEQEYPLATRDTGDDPDATPIIPQITTRRGEQAYCTPMVAKDEHAVPAPKIKLRAVREDKLGKGVGKIIDFEEEGSPCNPLLRVVDLSVATHSQSAKKSGFPNKAIFILGE